MPLLPAYTCTLNITVGFGLELVGEVPPPLVCQLFFFLPLTCESLVQVLPKL